MASINTTKENPVQEYMQLINRMDELVNKFNADKATVAPEKVASLDERMEDIGVIRAQLVTKVKQSGISREILDETRRLLSIF